MSDPLWLHGLWPARLLCPWDSPGKNTGVLCHFLLQGIFPTREFKLGLLHYRQILYHFSHQGIEYSWVEEDDPDVLNLRELKGKDGTDQEGLMME